MGFRSRSLIAPLALLSCGAFLSSGNAWVSGPNRAAVHGTEAHTSASSVAGANALILASMPLPAHAGGMFDFGITLPFVAITFLAMMATLNALWYAPVTSEMDERNSKLLQTLSEATDMLAKADEIQVEYTEQIREARESASKALSEYRQKTEKVVNAELDAATAQRDAESAKLREKLEAEVEAKMQSSEAEIETRKKAFVKETLASIAL